MLNIVFIGESLNAFSMNLGVRLRCSLAVLVTIVPEALPSSLNEENKIIKTGKKIT